MPIETVMGRIGEIRSMVGLDVSTQSVAETEKAPATKNASATADLPEAFSKELSAAVDAGNSADINQLIQSYTEKNPGASIPELAAGVGNGAVDSSTKVRAPAEDTPINAETKMGSTANGSRVVAEAKQYLGVPYVWGGTNPAKGLDCSGLVQLVYKDLGYPLPRVARDQAKQGTEISSLSKAQPGDLIGMRNGSHIAIYLGDNKILHAPQPGSKVSIRELHSGDDIDTIRRIVKADQPNASTVNVTSDVALSQAQQLLASFTTSKAPGVMQA